MVGRFAFRVFFFLGRFFSGIASLTKFPLAPRRQQSICTPIAFRNAKRSIANESRAVNTTHRNPAPEQARCGARPRRAMRAPHSRHSPPAHENTWNRNPAQKQSVVRGETQTRDVHSPLSAFATHPWKYLELKPRTRRKMKSGRRRHAAAAMNFNSNSRWAAGFYSNIIPATMATHCPYRLVRPRTPGFHPGNSGSNPDGGTKPRVRPRTTFFVWG